MLYNLRHALAVNVETVLGQWRSATFVSVLYSFWPCSPIKTSDRVSGMHRSTKVYSAEPQRVRKSDLYSETKVFLSSNKISELSIAASIAVFVTRDPPQILSQRSK